MDGASSPLSNLSQSPQPHSQQRSASSKKSSARSSAKKESRPTSSQSNSASKAAEESQPRRSGRSGNNKRTYVEESSEDELAQSSPPPPKKTKTSPPASSSAAKSRNGRRQPLRGNFSPDYLLKNPKSVIANTNKLKLRELLALPGAWTALDRSEQLQLVRMLPGHTELEWPDDMEVPSYPSVEVRTNSTLREACNRFQNNLADGRYTDAWLQKAQHAMKERIKGKFDSWKEREMEAFWGQKQKVDWNALAGESSKYTLPDLIKGGCFQNGDVFRFEITRGHKKQTQITMIKEATVTSVDQESGTLDFSFPPGQHESVKDEYNEGEKEVRFESCNNTTPLLVKMMAQDGRVDPKERMNNAWKLVRILRNKQDMGALFDVRERHANKMSK